MHRQSSKYKTPNHDIEENMANDRGINSTVEFHPVLTLESTMVQSIVAPFSHGWSEIPAKVQASFHMFVSAWHASCTNRQV